MEVEAVLARAANAFRFSVGAQYVGALGLKNLGDEAVYQALRRCWKPLRVSRFRPSMLARSRDGKEHRCAVLGGGTLIGPGKFLSRFRCEVERTGDGIIFATGVTPVTEPGAGAWMDPWAEVLGRCSFIGVRGPDSAEAMKCMGVKAEIIGDMACFFAQPLGYWQPVAKRLGLCIGTSYGNVYGSEPELIREFTEFVKKAVATGWDPEFYVVWPADLPVTLKVALAAGVPHAPVYSIYSNTENFLKRVRRTSAFVGLKLHSVVLAMCAGVPSIMLEYRPKCADFMKSVDSMRFSIRTDEVTAAGIMERLELVCAEGSVLAAATTERLLTYRRTQLARAAEIVRRVLRQNE